MSQDNTAGASDSERLLQAARDNAASDEAITTILENLKSNSIDINDVKDGVGNTALHLAASNGSTDVLKHILSHPGCIVDPINTFEKATPLHLALGISDPDKKLSVVTSLLDAGANTRIKDTQGRDVLELVPEEIKALINEARANASISRDDIADDDDDDEDDEDLDSGSDSDD